MRTLLQALLDTDLARLRVIARFWDVELTTNRQRDVARFLSEAMATPEAVAAAWEGLPDDQRQALSTLLAAGGRMPARVFARDWGEIRPVGPGRLEREELWREPVSPAEGLWYRGLLFRAFDAGSEGPYEAVFIPAELTSHLPPPGRPLSPIHLEPCPPPRHIYPADDALLDDSCTLLSYLQNERVRPGPDGAWPASHQARLIRRLRDAQPDRLALLHHLAGRLGWTRVGEQGHLRPDPRTAAPWLQAPAREQRAALAVGWRDDPTWNDLWHVPTLRPDDTGGWGNDPLLARRAVLGHLAAATPGAWYALDGFVAAVKEADPDFQRPDGDYTAWYIRDAATGAYLSGFESWDRVEGVFIVYFITRPLAWLGLVDLGAEGPGLPPTAFRLTAAGSAFLGLAEPEPTPKPPPLTLRSDFILLVPAGWRYERFQLSRVAEWMETGDPFVYRLAPTSLARARQQGIAVGRILAFLREATGTPVPRTVEAALTRWETHGSEVRLERGVLLHTADEALMGRILASPATRRFIRERVAPTAAWVVERDWSRLVTALGELGLLPDVLGLEGKDEPA